MAPKRKRDELYSEITEEINGTSRLPKATRKMLVDMVQSSLATAKDARHKFQVRVLDMVAGVFSESQAAIAQTVKELEASEETLQRQTQEREAAMTEIDADIEVKEEERQKLKRVLADSMHAYKATRQSLSDVKTALEGGEKELEDTSSKQKKLEVAFQDLVTPLIKGSVAEGDIEDTVAQLMAIMREFGFEQSLLTAVPASCSKLASARGPFDTMVLDQFTDELKKKLNQMSAVLKAGDTTKVTREKAVQEAEAVMGNAQTHLCESAAAYRKGDTAKATASERQEEAEQAVKELKAQSKQNSSTLAKMRRQLEALRDGPVKMFEKLRNCASREEQAEVVAEAEEADKEE